MIPQDNIVYNNENYENHDVYDINEIKIKPLSDKTYKLNLSNNTFTGFTNGLDAIKQSIYKILNTQRYAYSIYSSNYGISITDLFGKSIEYIYSELKRRITEALTLDERIVEVNSFLFNSQKGKINVTFKVLTLEGEVEIERVVNI